MFRQPRSLFACLLALPLLAAPARADLLPDIRGLSFTSPFESHSFLGGIVPGFGPVTDPLVDPRALSPFDPIPHTFDVVADPAAPNDPARIQINTRLFYNPDALTAPVLLTLLGTYDRNTGVLSASGGAIGTFLNDRGPDPFGVAPGTNLFEQLTNPMESLHGVVSVAPGQIVITGTDAVTPDGGPGNISFGAVNLLFIPSGSADPSQAVLTLPVLNPYGGIYDWRAVAAVPEPS